MIGETLLAGLLSACASTVAPATMHAVVMVESGANPLSIGDNTAHRSYNPPSYLAAVAIASDLVGQGHSLDLGIAQVNSMHLTRAVTIADLFEPCRNLQVASAILAGDYARARSVYSEPQRALRAALGAYNTGRIYAGAAYVARVVAAAGVPSVAILSERPGPPQALVRQRSIRVALPMSASTPVTVRWRGTWGRP